MTIGWVPSSWTVSRSWRPTTVSTTLSAPWPITGEAGQPVVSAGRVVGVLSVKDAMAAYRTALSSNVRQVRGLRAGGVIVEGEIGPDSGIAGRRVSEIAWPEQAVLVAIERGDGLLVPRGDLRLTPGDRISVFSTPAATASVEALLGASSDGEAQSDLQVLSTV